MSDTSINQGSWSNYYQATSGDAPHTTLLKALELFGPQPLNLRPRLAVDLGCGAGNDTRELLRAGWRVLAVDAEAEALAWVQAGLTAADLARLDTQAATFEHIALPPADLVNASYALPLCPPAHFAAMWANIVAAIPTGGRFAGHFFGEKDSWAGRPEITHHTQAQVQALFSAFEIEYSDEMDKMGQTVSGYQKHWHVFSVVARKK